MALYTSGILSMWDSPSVMPHSAVPSASLLFQLNWKQNQFYPQNTKYQRAECCMKTLSCLTKCHFNYNSGKLRGEMGAPPNRKYKLDSSFLCAATTLIICFFRCNISIQNVPLLPLQLTESGLKPHVTASTQSISITCFIHAPYFC